MFLNKPYNRERAVEYARRWALSRNPLFENFSGIGGDCTNFVFVMFNSVSTPYAIVKPLKCFA